MRKLKGGMRGSKLFDTMIYLVIRLATKGTLTSTLLKHSQRVLLLGNQVSSGDTESPQSP